MLSYSAELKLPSPDCNDAGLILQPSINTWSPIAKGNLVSVEAYPVCIGRLNCWSNNNSAVTVVPLWLIASIS